MKQPFSVLMIVGLVVVSSCTGAASKFSDTAADEVIFFTGKVSRGQSFVRDLDEGLRFRLVYGAGDGEGWHIWVGDSEQLDHDFSRCVTPPFRGLNSRYIEGWHFRNDENSGPRTTDDHSAPQEARHFAFVLSEADYHAADGALDKLLWPYQYSEEEVQQAQQIYDQLETATGVLTITGLELGNLIAGERAWIEQMEFEVELVLPNDREM